MLLNPLLRGQGRDNGISVLEILLMFSFLCAVMLSFTLLMGQLGQNAKGIYLQSSRSILLQSSQDKGSPQNPLYVTLYNDSAFDNNNSESGQVLPLMQKIDTTNAGATNSFQKTIYTYLYNNSTDSASSSRFQAAMTDTTNSIGLRWGWNNSAPDNSGRFMYGGDSTYNNSTHQPGEGGAYTDNCSASNLTNTSNQGNYKCNVSVSSGSETFQFNVANGFYTVKLLFADNNASTSTSSPNRRLMDIYIQGAQVNSGWPYGVYEYTGNTANRAQALTFDAYVSSGVLSVQLVKSSASNLFPQLSAIIVKPRTAL